MPILGYFQPDSLQEVKEYIARTDGDS